MAMPKQKSNKSIRKRMKVTANGKIKRHKSNKRHLLAGRTTKRKRQLRRTVIETGRIARKYILALGRR
jgi:large subunit ribosomal protein L35